MSKALSGTGGLTAPIIKSVIFIVVTALTTTLLALTIVNGSTSGGHTYRAVFTDATKLQAGDDIRMAGVRIGQVQGVSVYHRRDALVTFTLPSDRLLARTVSASIRFRNLIGQRYVELDQGTGALSDPLPNNSTIPLDRTQDALDLTVSCVNGFEPLFSALQPHQVNELSAEIIQVFQGEGPTVGSLLSETATLTNSVANKDAVIGRVINNLNSVLGVVNQPPHPALDAHRVAAPTRVGAGGRSLVARPLDQRDRRAHQFGQRATAARTCAAEAIDQLARGGVGPTSQDRPVR